MTTHQYTKNGRKEIPQIAYNKCHPGPLMADNGGVSYMQLLLLPHLLALIDLTVMPLKDPTADTNIDLNN